MSAAPPAGVATLAPRMLARAGRVLLAWALLIALENVVVGVGYRHLFVGYWEMAAARVHLSPLLLVALVPAALALACAAEVSQRAPAVTLRRASSAAAALFGAVAALSVSTGRHTESWAVRAPFMLATGLALGAIAWAALPRLHAASPGQRAALGVGLTGALWSADSFVLPRLYPGFHWACFFLLLPASSLLAGAWGGARSEAQGGAPRRWPDRVAYGALALALAFAPLVPRAARAVSRQDNLRLVLLERAPLLGRAVRLAARVAPPEDTNEAPAVPGLATESARALDWTGGDVVLLTVDALRADHVTSYGYGRATTPHLDALAARGTRFDRAYCATPHTSYSVTSMLTGKYMKPLLALGVGDDSETWAALLRRYGFRTAGFYPPAVFFIDEARFATFRDSGFGFEYRKVEFADRATRVAQVKSYLSRAPHDKPLFLWVHLFEPHEPYEAHAGHIFGEAGRDVDRYDSEIAEADATVGDISAEVERRRPGATLLVTADHGEEFGEHGGRYHGTTVYEEQVRVPLVIVGRGVRAQVASAPVQTIDLLPTVLSALGIPRPARVRGRDLGAILRDGEVTEAAKRGFAFSETDDYALVAEGSERLVCARKVGACTLFDVATDPGQRRDRGGETPARLRALRARLAQTERDHGRYEGGAQRPEALRRGRQGDVDAAEDVAALFDDASVAVRREAAEVAFLLHQPSTTNGARRALAREDDPAAKSFLSLVLVRSGATDEALGGRRSRCSRGPTRGGVAAPRSRSPTAAIRAGSTCSRRGSQRSSSSSLSASSAPCSPATRPASPSPTSSRSSPTSAFARSRRRRSGPSAIRPRSPRSSPRSRPSATTRLGSGSQKRSPSSAQKTKCIHRLRDSLVSLSRSSTRSRWRTGPGCSCRVGAACAPRGWRPDSRGREPEPPASRVRCACRRAGSAYCSGCRLPPPRWLRPRRSPGSRSS